MTLVSDWALPWNPEVLATDASLEGWAISSSRWAPADVALVGRNRERDRFLDPLALDARRAALGDAGLLEAAGLDEAGAAEEEKLLEAARLGLARSGLAVDRRFAEVPSRLLGKEDWRLLSWGSWRFAGEIGELEARALVKGVKRICLTSFWA